MSRSVWIINRIGWEYDDSNYYKSESGGTPYQAYTDREIALSFLKDIEARELRSVGQNLLSDFIRSDDYRADLAEDLESLCKILHLKYNDGEISFSKPFHQYSDEELRSIADAFYVSFYELVEVELVA